MDCGERPGAQARAYTAPFTLIESPDIPTVGVGEATIPGIIDFIKFLNIDQNDFMQHVQSTIKLAIRFIDWHHVGHRYWHPFGPFGVFIDRLPFYHFWHKARAQGLDVDLEHFNLEIAMAEQNRFIFPGKLAGDRAEPSLRAAFRRRAGCEVSADAMPSDWASCGSSVR